MTILPARRMFLLPGLLLFTLFITACSAAQPPTAAPPTRTEAGTNLTTGVGQASPASSDLARTDSQGAVEFAVTPLNLTSPGETLEFDVSLNTHSVDLSWDLAAHSTLTTDTGLAVIGQSWPVGSGHPYDGKLIFPAKTADGQTLLDGAKVLTLTIRDTDVPERVLVCEFSR